MYRTKIIYNTNYNPNPEDKELKYTSAHEIEHTILKAYGGTFYSYGHKGSVNTFTQTESSDAEEYSKKGEIDSMPYYTNVVPLSQYERLCSAEKDAISLIWLTK